MLLLGGCDSGEPLAGGAATPNGGPGVAIVAYGLQWKPASLEAAVDVAVTWTNQDTTRHTVTSGTPDALDERFDETLEPDGGSFSIAFHEPGRYSFFCQIHPNGMRGEIRVA